MRIEDLPYTGYISNGIELRRHAANAISFREIQAGIAGGPQDVDAQLEAFFEGCRAAVPGAAATPGGTTDEQVVLTNGDTVDVNGTEYTVEVADGAITGFTPVVPA